MTLARISNHKADDWLSHEEQAAIRGEGDPYAVIRDPYPAQ